ncbi:MAG TPA: J domain-containing protein [Candidatus Limnocylindrales bacterium]
MTDYYKVLQVDTEAELDVIQAAYRRLARKFHPDRSAGPEAVIRMVEINAAWEVLRNATRRANHDRELGIVRPQASSQARPIDYRRAPRSTADLPGRDEGLSPEHDPRTRAGASAEARRDEDRPGSATSGTVPEREGASRDRRGAWASGGSFGRASSERAAPARGLDGAGATEGPQAARRSRAWTSDRSTTGSTYDPATMGSPDGLGAAGEPPGHPSGSVMTFGRYAGWSLGEIARVDSAYLEWLERMPVGRMYRDEIDALMRRMGRGQAGDVAHERRGLFGR